MYSTQLCADCIRSKKELTDHGVVFEVRDVEKDPGVNQEFLAIVGNGSRNIPRILIQREVKGELMTVETLIEPTTKELTDSLVSNGFISLG